MGLIMLGGQKYITAELLVPEPSASDVEMAVGELKRQKSPGTDKILTELIKARGKTTHCEIHKFINSIWNSRNCLRNGGVGNCTYL
jgi:hypothetical protein